MLKRFLNAGHEIFTVIGDLVTSSLGSAGEKRPREVEDATDAAHHHQSGGHAVTVNQHAL
jgi:tyrosyl-tRNA synthetase